MLIKHSKVKNTGILFELLVRQVTNDVLTKGNSPAVRIMKKHFTNSAPVNRSQAPMGESLEYTPTAPATASSNISIELEDEDFGSVTQEPTPVKSAPATSAKADDLDDLFADL
jgi:hypothetical protein